MWPTTSAISYEQLWKNHLGILSSPCSGSRDIGLEAPEHISGRTRRKLAQAAGNSIGKHVTVSTEVHHDGVEDSSEEDIVQPDVTASPQPPKMDRQHQRSDAGKGTLAT